MAVSLKRLSTTGLIKNTWEKSQKHPLVQRELTSRLRQWERNQTHYTLILTLLLFALGALMSSFPVLVKMAPAALKMGMLTLLAGIWLGLITWLCLHLLISFGESTGEISQAVYAIYNLFRVLWLACFLAGMTGFSYTVLAFVFGMG